MLNKFIGNGDVDTVYDKNDALWGLILSIYQSCGHHTLQDQFSTLTFIYFVFIIYYWKINSEDRLLMDLFIEPVMWFRNQYLNNDLDLSNNNTINIRARKGFNNAITHSIIFENNNFQNQNMPTPPSTVVNSD